MSRDIPEFEGMTFSPIHDRVLIKVQERNTEISGLILPEQARELPILGEVVKVGDGKPVPPIVSSDYGVIDAISMTVKIGDTVLFNKYGGADLKIDGAEHRIVRESEILAIVSK